MSDVDKIAKDIVDIAGDCPTPIDWPQTKRWLAAKIAAALRDEREKLAVMIYETAPGEFSPDGWTWKQAFTAEKARRIEAEAALAAKNEQGHRS